MKKKMVSILTAAFCASALLAGCGSADTAKTSASSAGAASSSADGTTTFTVGFDAEYPPYGYMDDETGDYTGFDLELAEAVCEIYGWKLVKTPINWDAKDTELNSGAIDCIWNGFTMNGREDDYTWSDPYVDNSQVMVVSENSGINSLSDLAGKTVGVQAASAALDLLQSEEEGGQKELADTFAALQQFPDYKNAFVELQAGSIDAVAMDIGVAKYQLESRGEGELRTMEQRYDVAGCLLQGKVYSEIRQLTGASSATVSRVNRMLNYGTGAVAESVRHDLAAQQDGENSEGGTAE